MGACWFPSDSDIAGKKHRGAETGLAGFLGGDHSRIFSNVFPVGPIWLWTKHWLESANGTLAKGPNTKTCIALALYVLVTRIVSNNDVDTLPSEMLARFSKTHSNTIPLCRVICVDGSKGSQQKPTLLSRGGTFFETPTPRLRPLLRLALEPRHLLKCPRKRAARHLETPGRIDSKAVRSVELIWPWVTSPATPQ